MSGLDFCDKPKSSSFEVLSYHIILGIDWLEQFNPMEAHWSEKWLSFAYKGAKVKFQGGTT